MPQFCTHAHVHARGAMDIKDVLQKIRLTSAPSLGPLAPLVIYNSNIIYLAHVTDVRITDFQAASCTMARIVRYEFHVAVHGVIP